MGSKLNWNRKIQSNRIPISRFNDKEKTSHILGFDSEFPYGKYKGRKVADMLKENPSYVSYVFKEKIYLFTVEVGNEIKRIRQEYFNSLPIERQQEITEFRDKRQKEIRSHRVAHPLEKKESILIRFKRKSYKRVFMYG